MTISAIAATPTASDSSGLAHCPVCIHFVPAGAKKCLKCDTWLKGWRSVLPLTDTSLSLILAFTSVLTIIVPPAVRWIARESLTRVAIVTGDPKGDLQVSVSNIGGRPTVLRSYAVDFVGAENFLPRQVMTPRNSEFTLLMADKDGTVNLFGAEIITLPNARKPEYDQFMKNGVVRVTACVKESGSGVAKANVLAQRGTCESQGLVSRTDSIAASHLSEWINGRVKWEKPAQSEEQQ